MIKKNKTGIPKFVERNPVISIIGAINAAIVALIAVAVAFGLDITEQQVGAITNAVFVIANLAAALYAMRYVTPVSDPRTEHNEPATLVPRSIEE